VKALTLQELIKAVNDSNMETEAKAEIVEILENIDFNERNHL